jgi:hypothetical protein
MEYMNPSIMTELRNLYLSPNVISVVKRRAKGDIMNGRDTKCTQSLVEKPEGKEPLGRPRRRWEDNYKMDFREIGYQDIGWIQLVWDRRTLVNMVTNLQFP